MDLWQIFGVAVIVFAAAMIQALFGFGFALISVPLMIFFVELQTAVVTATVMSTVSCLIQWWQSRNIDTGTMPRRLIFASLIGMPFGLWLLVNVDPQVMKALLGLVVMAGVVMSIKGSDLRRLSKTFDLVMGIISGVLATATSTNGPPLVFLLHSRHLSPPKFRAVLNRVFTATNFLTLAMFAIAGQLNAEALKLAFTVVPVMVIAVLLGIAARPRVHPEHFRNIVVGLLFLSGLSAIFSAMFG